MQTTPNFKEKFKYLDIFGCNPQFYINNETKFRTTFGAILSLILVGIVAIACWIYGNDIYYKRNPSVSQSEEFTLSPEFFKINKNTMNFA